MKTYKCATQQYLIEGVEEKYKKVTNENIRELVAEWEYEQSRGRAQSDDTQIMKKKIKKYFKKQGWEYCAQNITNLGYKRYLDQFKPTDKFIYEGNHDKEYYNAVDEICEYARKSLLNHLVAEESKITV